MKTIVVATALLLTGALKAQEMKETEVPAPVLKAFHDTYKDASAKSWEKEKNNTYEVEFNWNSKESYAILDANGQWLESGNKLTPQELPTEATAYISKNYPKYKVSEVKQVVAPTGDITYEAEIKNGKSELEITFDGDGKLKGKKAD